MHKLVADLEAPLAGSGAAAYAKIKEHTTKLHDALKKKDEKHAKEHHHHVAAAIKELRASL